MPSVGVLTPVKTDRTPRRCCQIRGYREKIAARAAEEVPRARVTTNNIALMQPNSSHWEFCLCYRDGEFSHWEWRRHDHGSVVTSGAGFPSLSTCVHDAMKNGYTGGGTIMPGIVGTSPGS